MVEKGAPGQRSPRKGVPPDKGVPKEEGVPKDKGVPPEEGVPPKVAILPGDGRLPGTPGQLDPGSDGQLHKDAENPWAPSEETVVTDEGDLVLPPSHPERGRPAGDDGDDEPGDDEPDAPRDD